jgi:hypothetical protein
MIISAPPVDLLRLLNRFYPNIYVAVSVISTLLEISLIVGSLHTFSLSAKSEDCEAASIRPVLYLFLFSRFLLLQRHNFEYTVEKPFSHLTWKTIFFLNETLLFRACWLYGNYIVLMTRCADVKPLSGKDDKS